MKKLIFYCSFIVLSVMSQAQPTPDPDRWELFTESYDGATNVFIDKQTVGSDSAWFLLTNAIDTEGNKTNALINYNVIGESGFNSISNSACSAFNLKRLPESFR